MLFIINFYARFTRYIWKRINIAWLKRDLRICDNQVLQVCEDSNIPYEIIYIFDPKIIKKDNLSYRHLQFVYHSILDINDSLKKYNRDIKCFYGPSDKIFQNFIKTYNIDNIYAYQETGILETFNRDKKIKKISNDNDINFIEFEKDGVVRGLKSRKGWDQRWFKIMSTQLVKNSFSKNLLSNKINNYQLPKIFLAKISRYSRSFCKARI